MGINSLRWTFPKGKTTPGHLLPGRQKNIHVYVLLRTNEHTHVCSFAPQKTLSYGCWGLRVHFGLASAPHNRATTHACVGGIPGLGNGWGGYGPTEAVWEFGGWHTSVPELCKRPAVALVKDLAASSQGVAVHTPATGFWYHVQWRGGLFFGLSVGSSIFEKQGFWQCSWCKKTCFTSHGGLFLVAPPRDRRPLGGTAPPQRMRLETSTYVFLLRSWPA